MRSNLFKIWAITTRADLLRFCTPRFAIFQLARSKLSAFDFGTFLSTKCLLIALISTLLLILRALSGLVNGMEIAGHLLIMAYGSLDGVVALA